MDGWIDGRMNLKVLSIQQSCMFRVINQQGRGSKANLKIIPAEF